MTFGAALVSLGVALALIGISLWPENRCFETVQGATAVVCVLAAAGALVMLGSWVLVVGTERLLLVALVAVALGSAVILGVYVYSGTTVNCPTLLGK